VRVEALKSKSAQQSHPERSEAESKDPGALRKLLQPGSSTSLGTTAAIS